MTIMVLGAQAKVRDEGELEGRGAHVLEPLLLVVYLQLLFLFQRNNTYLRALLWI